MKKFATGALIAAALSIPAAAIPTAAQAQTGYYNNGYSNNGYYNNYNRNGYYNNQNQNGYYSNAQYSQDRGYYRDRNGYNRNGYDQNNGYNRDGDWRWQDRNNGDWDPARHYREDRYARARRLSRNDYVYRGSDGRYYCRRSNGTTGTVVGAIGGGVLGNVLGGGGALGTLLGAGGGALLGRSIDKGNVTCR